MALGFSLSPAVTVQEINATANVPNIPSAITGAVLRSAHGPALEISSVTNETDLISLFGKPTADNYQDWFLCWNFLQYASSLKVVRPLDSNLATKNAGIGLTGNLYSESVQKGSLYNRTIAEQTLEQFTGSDTLYFFNKDCTSDQRYSVAVCSNPQYFTSNIGLEYFANITSNGASGSTTVVASSSTLTKGSQVILNDGRLATVVSTTNNGSTTTLVFDVVIKASDVDRYWGTVFSTPGVSAVGTNQWSINFSKTRFSLQEGNVLAIGGLNYIVDSVNNNSADNSNSSYLVTVSATATQATPAVSGAQVVSSSTNMYIASTSAQADNTYNITAGAVEVYLQPGFILEPGIRISLTNGSATAAGYISSLDTVNNKITLVAPLAFSISATGSLPLTIVTPAIIRNLVGINFLDQVYDSTVINKSRVNIVDNSGNNSTVIAQSLVTFKNLFEYQPKWAKDEFCVVVLYKNDSGLYQKAEARIVSYRANGKDISGNSNFIENVFFSQSALYAKVGSISAQPVDTANQPLPKIVNDTVNGSTIYPKVQTYGVGTPWTYNGAAYTQGDIDAAAQMFADPESVDVNILINHQMDLNLMSTIAETRKDCFSPVGPFDYSYLSTNGSSQCTKYLLDNFGTQTEFSDKLFSTFGTYTAIYGNMKYQYDKFNNVNRWINISGDIAGLCAQTDNTNDPWWAVAGGSRGVIKNCIKLAFNPNRQNRDDLYVNGINPIMAVPGEGNAVVWGQKTATAFPSAFDRLNVRRLLIYLEKSIATACNIGLFEFNDVYTRARLFGAIDPFLRTVKARRGLYAYKVVIDDTNNTRQVIDANGLVVTILLQPEKVAEFISLQVIVTPTGVNFNEYIGVA